MCSLINSTVSDFICYVFYLLNPTLRTYYNTGQLSVVMLIKKYNISF